MTKGFFLFILTVLSVKSFADVNMSSTSITPSKQGKSAELPISGSVGYSVGTDLNDKTSPSSYTNRLEMMLDWKATKNSAVSLMTDYHYDTVGKDVEKDQNTSSFSDTTLKYSYLLKKTKEMNLGIGLSNAFPTSRESQEEGYSSMPAISGKLGLNLTRTLEARVRLSSAYVVNKYDYSPATLHAEPQNFNSATGTLSYDLLSNLNASLAAKGTQITFVDGSQEMRASNEASVDLTIKHIDFSVNYTVGQYNNHTQIRDFIFDETQALLELGVAYVF